MGLQSGNVAPAHASTAEGPPFWRGTTRSLAQVLELLMLLMPVLLMPVPPPHVISSRWLLLPVTAARTHASCSVSCKLHSLDVVCPGAAVGAAAAAGGGFASQYLVPGAVVPANVDSDDDCVVIRDTSRHP